MFFMHKTLRWLVPFFLLAIPLALLGGLMFATRRTLKKDDKK